ncbi:nucleoside recognition domain-containing protein [Marinomonas fungiae]|uniref:Nucleoside recognition n=1 Tax=Marinomonas fungiae TaxID=1137284 RepID=A0A0K6IM15_9GAMM|nr:nucleoside recognition domain-containing protein [Marinomonas fungiae]CUB04133.1 Nucleoside recognition [Marinomonas fungiae]
MSLIEIILSSGRSSVDIALYTLLPIMIVMLCIMKVLEAIGIMDFIVSMLSPLLKPFGLTGMSTFALLQMNFISFAAPLATLMIMQNRGISDRHLAATLAMLLAMGQGNILYPMIPLGLNWTAAIAISIIGGLCASTFTWYVSGQHLSHKNDHSSTPALKDSSSNDSLVKVINDAGLDAIRLTVAAVPMLTLSITIVGTLKAFGAITALENTLSPLLNAANISSMFVMPTLAKYLGGGTAYLGIASDLVQQGNMTITQINISTGFLVNTFDLPGIGIFLGLSYRFVSLFKYAILGILLGIAVRTLLHFLIFN